MSINRQKMEHIYGNIDHELHKYGHHMTGVSDCTGQPLKGKTSDVSKVTKIVLGSVSILLLLCLGITCTLSFFYYNKVVSLQALNEQYVNATASLDALSASVASELKSYTDLQVRYEKQLATVKETEAKYEELKDNYQKAYKAFSSCTGCQNCELCENGWMSLGLKCYSFSNVKLNWTKSRDYCAEKGAHLAIITSQAEQKFLSSHSSQIGGALWIGLNDLETEGKWMWVNNVSLNQTGVMFWYARTDIPDEPDNWTEQDPSGENCACLVNKEGNILNWFDRTCRSEEMFICEK